LEDFACNAISSVSIVSFDYLVTLNSTPKVVGYEREGEAHSEPPVKVFLCSGGSHREHSTNPLGSIRDPHGWAKPHVAAV